MGGSASMINHHIESRHCFPAALLATFINRRCINCCFLNIDSYDFHAAQWHNGPCIISTSFDRYIARHGLTQGRKFRASLVATQYTVTNRFTRHQRRHLTSFIPVGIGISLSFYLDTIRHWCDEAQVRMPTDEVCIWHRWSLRSRRAVDWGF